MSLILEALKKLEREKQAPDRGFVVMAPVSWPAAVTPRSLLLPSALLMVGVAVGAYVAVGRRELSAPVAATAAPAVVARAAGVPGGAGESTAAPRSAPAGPARVTARRAILPPAPADEPVELQAISQRDGKPVAVLNGRLVGEGDSFDQVRVLRIGANDVEVEVRGKRRLLKF